MANLKLNGRNNQVTEDDLSVLPDITVPDVEEAKITENNNNNNIQNDTSVKNNSNTLDEQQKPVKESYIKQKEVESRPLFANKKANVAIAVACGIIAIAIIAAIVFAYVI